MCKDSWIATIVCAAALSGTAIADTPASQATLVQPTRVAYVGLLDAAALPGAVSASAEADDVAIDSAWREALDDFEFEEGSALMRVAKLRNLSLLTLGEFGKSRLFFGVNDEGFVGLHFNAISRTADERYLEIVRMPYLQRDAIEVD